jgi:hypothetical protein
VAEKTHPATTMQAIASLPFNVAAAFADGSVGLETLEDTSRARADVCALAARTDYEIADLPGFAGELTIETTDGLIHASSGEAAEADAERLAGKFTALAARAIAPEKIDRAVEDILALADAPDVSAVAAVLRDAQPQ